MSRSRSPPHQTNEPQAKKQFSTRYEYPQKLPQYYPPEKRKNTLMFELSQSSEQSSQTSESDKGDDEFLGQFTSNHDFLQSNNQLRQGARGEGNAQISMTSHQREFVYRELVDDLIQSNRSCNVSRDSLINSFDKSLSQKALEKSQVQGEVNDLKEKLYSNGKVELVSAISLKKVDAFCGNEPIILLVTEFNSEFEYPQTKQTGKKGKKQKKKPQGFGFGKYSVSKLQEEEESDKPIKTLEIMRATLTKASSKREVHINSDQKKTKTKSIEPAPDKINEFIKTVVTGGKKSTDESENEGWQRNNFNQPEEIENRHGKKKQTEPPKVYVQKNTKPDSKPTQPAQSFQIKPETHRADTQKQEPSRQESQRQETQKQESQGSKKNKKKVNQEPTLQKMQSAPTQTPIFQFKPNKNNENIWAALEVAKPETDKTSQNINSEPSPTKQAKPVAKQEPVQSQTKPKELQQQNQQPTTSKKKKKKNNANNQVNAEIYIPQEMNAFQKVSFDILNVLGLSEETKESPYFFEQLASKLAQLYHDPNMQSQPNPWDQNEETKQQSREQLREPKHPEKELTEHEALFHDMVSAQVKQIVKNFEYKLDLVRKEREAAISIIESCVKYVFERPNNRSHQNSPAIPVGIKQYGSQANSLAIDSSDVDLAVTGLKLSGNQDLFEMEKCTNCFPNLNGGQVANGATAGQNRISGSCCWYKDLQLHEMRKLCNHLDDIRNEGFIRKLDFIETASVPLIKVQIDLQVIQEITRKRRQLQASLDHDDSFVPEPFVLLDRTMVILHIDITFDDYNASVLQQIKPTLENPQSGVGQQSQSPFQVNPFVQQQQQRQTYLPSASLAISSVHKIKELQLKYIDLRNIVLIVKKLLAKHNLHKPYSGGLNSYSIVLMTSTFLQKFGINHKSALSQNLSEFFKFFGDFFDPTILGLDGTKFFNLTPAQRLLQDHLVVLDIQNSANNTAKSSFRILEAKRVFSDAYRFISENLHKFEQTQSIEERMKINVIQQLIY